MEITDINQLDFNKLYTYADYLRWKFDERVELFKGKIFKMSPAPNRKHQEISGTLFGLFFNIFRNHPCKLYAAPFDVRLPRKNEQGNDIHTVVQPDLCVVCDMNKLDDKGCIGAPDLIIEILSPGNSKKEMKNKFQIYEESGVKEYWMINPLDEFVLVNVLENEKFDTKKPIVDDWVQSYIFPQLKIHTDDIFKE